MDIVRKLIDRHGISKYGLAKKLGVSWNTVQNWYRKIYLPTAANQTKLKKVLKIIAPLLIAIILFSFNSWATQTKAYWQTQASWYSNAEYPGAIMANGEEFNDEKLTCANWDYPFGTRLVITNSRTAKWVCVTVTDRGPAKSLYNKGRKIDLSKRAFSKLASLSQGVIEVQVREVLK